ncbi:PLDc N-terminal domain-containing protein [Oryzobacter sp. R7]|uniref:PLDc N-terminal domain-containing protein n=1 Tax=Oryzobacter faecalis TaxID=3388656 RepID=UPI00398D0050
MLRYLPVVLSLALTIYCVVDAIQTDEGSVRNLPKLLWLLLILLFPVVGPAAWLLAGRPQRSPRLGGLGQQQRWDDPSRRRDQKPPPRGPDDDPDFLKDL